MKSLAQSYTVPGFEQAAQPVESEAVPVVVAEAVIADGENTVAAAVVAQPAANGISEAVVTEETTSAVPVNQWGSSNDLSISQEWVDVKAPANPTEVDAGRAAQSWADDQPDPVEEVRPPKSQDLAVFQ